MNRFKKIMLIDDDVISNMLTQKMIEQAEYVNELKIFDRAANALIELETSIDYDLPVFPDLIFLDLNMPGIDGWQFLEKYKTYPEDLINKCGLYILSSTVSYDDIKKAQQYPFVSEFISKPLTLNKLNEIKKNKLHKASEKLL